MRNSKIKTGFTLIELLVVISIIALLLSIMMPALQMARDKARNMLCKSNQRQIATAFYLYSVQNHDTLPPFCDGTNENNQGTNFWPMRISPFLDVDVLKADTGSSRGYVAKDGKQNVFICPTTISLFQQTKSVLGDFSVNVTNVILYRSKTTVQKGQRLTNVGRHSEAFATGDWANPCFDPTDTSYIFWAPSWVWYGTTMWGARGSDYGRLYPKHSGKYAVVSYLDTHVDNVETTYTRTDPYFKDVLFWGYPSKAAAPH